MNTKKFLLPSVFLAITIVAYIVAAVTFCYTTKPEVATGEFPFSITYEYKGEVKTFSGVFKCEYYSSSTIWNEHNRHWEGNSVIDNPGSFENDNIIDQHDHMTLAIQENMHAGYFMGDPLHKDHYKAYDLEGPKPYVEYYDYKNGIEINEHDSDAVFEAAGFRILDYTYAEPIENSFSFSGILFKADNVSIFIAIALVFLLLCLIFVRRDKEYTYSVFDKIGMCLNFIIGIVVLPFVSVVCIFYDLNGGGTDILSQIAYNIPFIAIVCLALSIVFRRKGFCKTGFFIQFAGPALFALLLLLEALPF